MKAKITTDEVEQVISYLEDAYNKGLSFHKSAYVSEVVHMPSKKVAKIFEQLRESKRIVIEKYGRRTWRVLPK